MRRHKAPFLFALDGNSQAGNRLFDYPDPGVKSLTIPQVILRQGVTPVNFPPAPAMPVAPPMPMPQAPPTKAPPNLLVIGILVLLALLMITIIALLVIKH